MEVELQGPFFQASCLCQAPRMGAHQVTAVVWQMRDLNHLLLSEMRVL